MGKVINFLEYKVSREVISQGDQCWFTDYDGQEMLLSINTIWDTRTGMSVPSCRITQVEEYHFDTDCGMSIIGAVFARKHKPKRKVG